MRRLIERGDNVNEQDEDALFDQLEKSLGTIRQSAALARFVGAEGISGDVARAEAEVRRLATCIEALCQRAEQQHAVTTRLEIAAAKVETDLLGLRQAVEALSFPARGQTQIPARSSARSTAIGIVLALLVLGGSATAWMTAGREPTPGALAHRFVAQLSELRGVIGLVRPGDPVTAVRTMGDATSAAEPDTSPAPAEPVPAAPVPPAVIASVETAPAQSPAPTLAATSTSQFQPPATAVIPPPSVTSAPVNITPDARSETSAPAATPLVQSSEQPRAVRRLVLRATADTWVQVRRKTGRVLLRRTMKGGETWPVPADPDLILDTGNAGGLDLEVNGVPITLLGPKGGVIRNLPLDADPPGAKTTRESRGGP
jgi:hypothetical protein